MRICPLLRSWRHKAMITPINPLRSRLIISARATGQFFVRFKLFSNGNCPLDWNSNSMFYANPLLQKMFNLIWIIFTGQLGLIRSPSNARESVFERIPTTKKNESRAAQSADSWKAYGKPNAFNCLVRMIFCDSGHLHNEHKARHETKMYEHWQGPIERVRVNILNQWSEWWHKCTKQASSRSTV